MLIKPGIKYLDSFLNRQKSVLRNKPKINCSRISTLFDFQQFTNLTCLSFKRSQLFQGELLPVPGPRGAVGGCSTPGSRVDPWWNPGPLFPTVSTPGPPRIDEGPPGNNNQYCNTLQRTLSPPTPSYSFLALPNQHHHHQHQQQHHYNNNNNSINNNNSNHHHQQHQQQQHINRNFGAAAYSSASTTCSTASPTFGHVEAVSSRCSTDALRLSTTASNPYGLIGGTITSSRQSDNVLTALLAPKLSNVNSNTHNLSRGSTNNQQSSVSGTSTVLSSLLASTSSSGNPRNAVSASSSSSSSSRDSLNGILSSLNGRIKTEDNSTPRSQPEDRTNNSVPNSLSTTTSTNFNASLLSSLLSTSRISATRNSEEEELANRVGIKLEYSPGPDCQSDQVDQDSCVEYSLSGNSPCNVLETTEEDLAATSPYDIISTSTCSRLGKLRVSNCRSQQRKSGNGSSCAVVSPPLAIPIEMKYETQSGPPTGPPHMTSGVEPPHSSQGSGMVVGGSSAEVSIGVDSLMLSSWGATGPDFLEPPDVKQSSGGLQDAWDTLILGSTVGVASAQSLAELKPLPPFTGYTGHLSINGIPGHHYHTIASSGQRPSMQSSSPTPSSNQEYYESPVVSSSTPCPQVNQKQQQQQQQHQQQQQQQQLPQSTQQVDYDIEDIAEIIGSAIADTTVPGGGNGPGSEHDPDGSRDWIDIAEWIDTACSPKAHETMSPSPYSQIYGTTTASNQTQQHGSTLHSLLTGGYGAHLTARLQANNTGIASCGETPSSTSPYPPVSPPGRVSTSCSPDNLLHSSFATPSRDHRKRSRPGPGSQNPSKKSSNAHSALPYGTDSSLIGGKEKPVHRCSICNRGFLNKSNIKVHLRTHTGEKPFRCEICGKAFRQKAHLIKHQQIHKRIGRD